MELKTNEAAITALVTDLLLATVAIASAWLLLKSRSRFDQTQSQKPLIWSASLISVCIGTGLGSLLHGFHMPEAWANWLWQPVNLALGIAVSCFACGVTLDLKRANLPRQVIAALVSIGIGFYLLSLVYPRAALLFIGYQSLAMAFALITYVVLGLRRRSPEYFWMSAGILLSIVAAGCGASSEAHVIMIWEFNHAGLYHLFQTLGIFVLMRGLLPSPSAHAPARGPLVEADA